MRYIDADKIPRHGKRGGECYWQEIEQLQTADVVEVVRCKDCKHKYIDENGTYQCPFGLTGGEMFYCSYGERKKP